MNSDIFYTYIFFFIIMIEKIENRKEGDNGFFGTFFDGGL